ncbi:hypothetical protein RJ639_012312 [Escallonia herrerae]|uniref:Protein IQ-DOMAIN 1 n=1 Tax=Escallonia herrerae TaxID=1293975 RepID=A0AA88VMN6_9ASTE|nr:hypothetical protein RJ639_012312 [Escallonia herrerae]
MGSGDWFKNIISSKKVKSDKSKKLKGSATTEKLNGFKKEHSSQKKSNIFSNGRALDMPVEDVAAIRIQASFRAYMARKNFRHLKGMVRLQTLTQGHSVVKQASTTLSHLHTWSRIQGEIRARRICMVTESRIRQKKLENQLKLEAKLHGLEVEWSSGSETMEEVLARIHQREEASVKRERAMAYAFSHQWRANSNSGLGAYELGKANWGWSWMERWIAARPWESRALVQSSPKKTESPASKTGKNIKSATLKTLNSMKSMSPNGKGTLKARKLSYVVPDKLAAQQVNTRAEEANAKKEQSVSQ